MCCRLMGESNAVKIRQSRFKKSTWEGTKRAYLRVITQEERDSGYIPATFQVFQLSPSLECTNPAKRSFLVRM